MVEGNIIGSILEKEQMTAIRMIYPNSTKNSLENIKNQFVFLPDGKLKPLASLASIRLKEGVAEINRDNLKSVSIVTARLNNRDLGTAMKEIQRTIDSKIFLPQGYNIEYGGEYADQQKSFNELLLILILSSLLVFALMLFLFRDFRAAVLNSFYCCPGNFRKSDCSFHYEYTLKCGKLYRIDNDCRNNW